MAWALGWVAISAVWLVALFWDSAERAVRIWIESPTYSYAFLIAPLSVYLIFTKMASRPGELAMPMPAAAALQIPVGALWYAGLLIESVEIQQFCIIGGIYVAVLSILGHRFATTHWVALALLLFLVPSGQFIVPLLQGIGARATHALLLVSGVPAYRNGLVIELPASAYFIAPGCSGLNFVLVTAVLGLVLGEVLYAKPYKKALCFAALVLAAVAANPIRIFGIISIDWATNRSTDIVSDHLLYGWLFFGAILAALIPIATHFRDELSPDRPVEPGAGARPTLAASTTRGGPRTAAIAIAGLVLVALPPASVLASTMLRPVDPQRLPRLPSTVGQYALADAMPWRLIGPQIAATSARLASERGGTIEVEVFVRQAAVPGERLVDQLQGLAADARRQTLPVGYGEVALVVGPSGRMVRAQVACLLVVGRCQAAPGAYREAILRGFAANPSGRAALIVATREFSLPAPSDEVLAQAQLDVIAGLLPTLRAILDGS